MIPGFAASGRPALITLPWASNVSVPSDLIALWLIAFSSQWLTWFAAIILLLAPHIVGAPQPDGFAGLVPPELAATFASRALGVGLMAWAMLGVGVAYFWQRAEAD